MAIRITILVFSLCLAWGPPVLAAADCNRAEELVRRSVETNDQGLKERYLREALFHCPGHHQAHNNLGLVFENQGRLDLAAQHYRQALRLHPSYPPALAGLGDVALTQGRYQQAAENYRDFLATLPEERRRGDPLGLAAYEGEYRRRLKQAQTGWSIHKQSMNRVVSRGTLMRGFRTIGRKNKNNNNLISSRMALAIHFDYDSDQLNADGRAQLSELAQVLMSPEMVRATVLIEGHTDTLGDAKYNMWLSLRRAENVKQMLIVKGVDQARISVRGMGLTRPLITSGGISEQAANRRVEFVVNRPAH